MCEAIEKLGEARENAARIKMLCNFLNNGGSEVDAQRMLGVSTDELEKAKALMLQPV